MSLNKKDSYHLYDENNKGNGVLVIYTGGTIGSMPKDRADKSSPQVVVSWAEFKEHTPQIDEKELGFNVDAYSTEPLDSCNIGPAEWMEIANVIKESYDIYEGFCILHGTDSMVYTASALSLMFKNLGKPIILTGAQATHLFNVWNDGLQNLIGSLRIANPKYSNIPIIPEVCIFFNGKLFRGNRTRKINASGFNAYESANYPLLAEYGESLVVNKRVIRGMPQGKFNVRTKMETHVAALHFFPGIQDNSILKDIMTNKDLRGLVLMAYGAGNIPTKEEVIKLVKDFTGSGKVALIVTQTGGGKVELGMYDTSAQLLDAGTVSGVDITPEAALVKLMYILGDEDISPVEAAIEAQKSIAGEQSMSIYTSLIKSGGEIKYSVNKENSRFRIGGISIEAEFSSPEEIEKIVLRLKDGVVNSGSNRYGTVKIYRALASTDKPEEANYLGTFNQLTTDKPTILFFDITEKLKDILSVGRESLTLFYESNEGYIKWNGAELVVFIKSL